MTNCYFIEKASTMGIGLIFDTANLKLPLLTDDNKRRVCLQLTTWFRINKTARSIIYNHKSINWFSSCNTIQHIPPNGGIGR